VDLTDASCANLFQMAADATAVSKQISQEASVSALTDTGEQWAGSELS